MDYANLYSEFSSGKEKKWGWKKGTGAGDASNAAEHLRQSKLETLRNRPEYSAAIKFAKLVFLAWLENKDERYSGVYDQISRNSQSVANNLAEGHAKGQVWPERIARGEAYEALTCTEFLPPVASKLLKIEAEKLVNLLDNTLLNRWENK